MSDQQLAEEMHKPVTRKVEKGKVKSFIDSIWDADTNTFQKVFKKSNRKPNKLWEYKVSEFYNRSMKSRLEKMT